MSKVWAFDVDETLACAGGPITLDQMKELQDAGEIVGLCGNWRQFCMVVNDWHCRVSFINIGIPKEMWLAHFREMLPHYEKYTLVGNRMGVTGASDDEGAAKRAGWSFILERDFAAGAR